MAQTFNAEYLALHRQQIHTYDSFGRTFSKLALKATEAQRKKEGSTGQPVKLSVEVTISPVPKAGAEKTLDFICVDLQTCLQFLGCVTVHVGVSKNDQDRCVWGVRQSKTNLLKHGL